MIRPNAKVNPRPSGERSRSQQRIAAEDGFFFALLQNCNNIHEAYVLKVDSLYMQFAKGRGCVE